MQPVCKRCLLLEAGEHAAYQNVKAYLDTLPADVKVSAAEYKKRLALCAGCDFLIAGMCRKCGCYVEVRAALKEKNCPYADQPQW